MLYLRICSEFQINMLPDLQTRMKS